MEERPNTIYFHSVIDRLILKKKVLEHFLRSLAEKQALLKFYSLSNENNPALEANNFHPLIVGTHLLGSKKQNIIEERIDETTKKSWNYLLPYLLNYVEVLFQTKEDQITKYFVEPVIYMLFQIKTLFKKKQERSLPLILMINVKLLFLSKLFDLKRKKGNGHPKLLLHFNTGLIYFF